MSAFARTMTIICAVGVSMITVTLSPNPTLR
jgi:hypothetical protein